jgi:IS30 family transposase
MARTGRPKALDDEKRGQVRLLVSMGCKLKHAARYVGCSACTLRREVQRNAEFRQELAAARHGFEASMLHTITQAAATQPSAAAWLRRHVSRM